jgi:hypothetical protein
VTVPAFIRPAIVITIAVVVLLAAATPLLAAPPAKGTAVGSSFATSGGSSVGAASHTVVADMTVPAGKYHVSARGTVNNQTGADIESVACNAYGGTAFVDSGTTAARTGYSGFAIEGVVDLAAGGTIRVECISTADPGPFVSMSLVADVVASITVLP